MVKERRMGMDSGSGIKIIATVLLVVGIVASVISGLVFMGTFTFIGIVIMVVGTLLSLVISAILNGFGELICQNAESNRRLERLGETLAYLAFMVAKANGEIDPNSKWQPNTDDY